MNIISLLKNRDEKGLSLLYDNYAPNLLGIIQNIVREKQIAEEVLQLTMLKIWDNINKYDPAKSTFYTWIARIARNSAIDKQRLKSYRNLKVTRTFDPILDQRETVQISTAAIDIANLTQEIGQKFQQVLDLVYLKGYTHKETAKILELPLGTVKSRLRIAISQLKDTLAREQIETRYRVAS